MGAKITITGAVLKVRKVENPKQKKAFINCLEIETGGSPNAPKGLPIASMVNYTVMCNDKQLNKLKRELETYNLPLKGGNILVQGEINLDQPLSVVEGEIGVIAFQLQSLDAMKLQKEQEQAEGPKQNKVEEEIIVETPTPIPTVLPLTQIFVPEAIRATRPRVEKLEDCINYYKEHGRFDKEIKVRYIEDKGWVLQDGYARLVAAEELGLTEINVFTEKKTKVS